MIEALSAPIVDISVYREIPTPPGMRRIKFNGSNVIVPIRGRTDAQRRIEALESGSYFQMQEKEVDSDPDKDAQLDKLAGRVFGGEQPIDLPGYLEVRNNFFLLVALGNRQLAEASLRKAQVMREKVQ